MYLQIAIAYQESIFKRNLIHVYFSIFFFVKSRDVARWKNFGIFYVQFLAIINFDGRYATSQS